MGFKVGNANFGGGSGFSNGVNGLNGSANIGLGGALTSNTIIDLATFSLEVQSSSTNFILNSVFALLGYQTIGGRHLSAITGASIDYEDALGTITSISASNSGIILEIAALKIFECVSPDDIVCVPLASKNYPNDAAAALGGIPLNGLYHTAGDIKIRLV